MIRWIFIQLVKRRLKKLNQHYRRCWIIYGPEHYYTESVKRRYHQCAISAIHSLETTFK
jgi:hypothetical protein